MDQQVMYKLSYGLFVLTSAYEGRESGCIINTAGQVTSKPNRISIAVNKSNFTHDLVKESGQFNLSILSESAGFDTFKHFGFQSGRDTDKFTGYRACRRSANGLYYITAGTNGFSGSSLGLLRLGFDMGLVVRISGGGHVGDPFHIIDPGNKQGVGAQVQGLFYCGAEKAVCPVRNII